MTMKREIDWIENAKARKDENAKGRTMKNSRPFRAFSISRFRVLNLREPFVSRSHPGQSLVIALSVMFLMVFVGAIFVTSVARNLSRVDRTSDQAKARFLAEAGLRYADQQLTFSDQGADWRPTPQWMAANAAEETARQLHPDYPWLSDASKYEQPWTSFETGDGRFLLRVTFEPTFRRGRRESTVPDQFDPLSGYIRIEAVGRPGLVDLNDPTTLAQPDNPNWKPGQVIGAHVYVQAYKPIGLTDQLWWVTNRTKQRGPAEMGVPPFEDGNGKWVRYANQFFGGIRSNVDLDWLGDTSIFLHPHQGDAVTVAGLINQVSVGNNPAAQVQVNLLDNADKPIGAPVFQGPSETTQFNPLVDEFSGRVHYADNLWFTNSTVNAGRAIRYLEPPQIDAVDPTTNENRYRRMTRDSGAWRRVTLAGETQVVNLGWYGYGEGIYVDNFGDIQYENDRDTVIDEWLQRGASDVAHTGWAGGSYTPSVREAGSIHPVTEIVLTPEGIQMTRADRDTRGRNFGADNKYKTRIFYTIDNSGALVPAGASNLFPYPQNGVLFLEGSARLKGTLGRHARFNDPSSPIVPVQLSVVSNGTIYVEGSLLKAHPASSLSIQARDYVTLNPTQFVSITPGEDVTVESDTLGPDARDFHYSVPQNKDIELSFQWAGTPLPQESGSGILLHLQHSGGYEDQQSRTDIAFYINGGEESNRYDFAAYPPPYPSDGTGGGSGQPAYSFFFFPPGSTANWWQSNAQSSTAGTVNYERKSFWIPADVLNTRPGAINTIRIHVEAAPGGQPYWLSRAAVTPYRNGLPEPFPVLVQAMMYAQNGSWFVIPTPWMNENTQDLRDQFAVGDPNSGRPALVRAPNTFPADSDDYPFFHEPLNMQVRIVGAITENMPATGVDRARWIQRLWLDKSVYAQADYQVPSWFQPGMRYEYDDSIRRWVRWRNLVTGVEGFAYTGPPQELPGGFQHIDQVRAAAMSNGQNVAALPIFPRLPAGALIYSGNPL
jgi:hypothetical protein